MPTDGAKQPIRMMNDRVMVQLPQTEGERRTRTGPPASICSGSGPGGPVASDPMAPTVTPLRADESALAAVRYDETGLVPAIVQEAGTGAVLMLAWMNEDTLR